MCYFSKYFNFQVKADLLKQYFEHVNRPTCSFFTGKFKTEAFLKRIIRSSWKAYSQIYTRGIGKEKGFSMDSWRHIYTDTISFQSWDDWLVAHFIDKSESTHEVVVRGVLGAY